MLQDFEFKKVKSAADLYTKLKHIMGVDSEDKYIDRKSQLSPDEYFRTLEKSTTLYVGGLSPFTFESYLVNYFSQVSPSQSL